MVTLSSACVDAPKETALAHLPADVTAAGDGQPVSPQLAENTRQIMAALPKTERSGAAVLRAEDVSLFAVHLPIRRARDRRQAAGFAVEGQLGAALEHTHIALGPKLAADTYLVAAIHPHHVTGRGAGRVVPEQMILPAPEGGSGGLVWNAIRRGDRALVRASDGTGFATGLDRLVVLWTAFGKPPVNSFGEALPAEMQARDLSGQALPPKRTDLRFDLRQGAYSTAPSLMRRTLAAVICAVMLAAGAQIALSYWTVWTKEAELTAAQTSVAAQLARVAPGVPMSQAALAALDRQIARRAAPKQDPFLSLMAQASAALADHPRVTLVSVNYAVDGPVLTLQLRATGIDVLRALAQRFTAMGLGVDMGALSASQAGADTTLTLRGARDGP